MRKNRNRRHAIVLAVALTVGFGPSLAEAQSCEVRSTLYSQNRKITGTVMEECGGECFLLWCEDAPFGNFGVNSDFSQRSNSDQFRGWKANGSRQEWNACTLQYYGSIYFNDGAGRQTSDASKSVGTDYAWSYPGVTCEDFLPEVHTWDDVYMKIYEMDRWTPDDHVTTLNYGDIDIQITCSSPYRCDGTSDWTSENSTDSTGVAADVRIRVTGRLR